MFYFIAFILQEYLPSIPLFNHRGSLSKSQSLTLGGTTQSLLPPGEGSPKTQSLIQTKIFQKKNTVSVFFSKMSILSIRNVLQFQKHVHKKPL